MVVFVIVLNASENERQIMSNNRRCGVEKYADLQSVIESTRVTYDARRVLAVGQLRPNPLPVQARPAADLRKVNI